MSMTPEAIAQAIRAAGGQDPNAPIGVPATYVPPIRTNQGFNPGSGPSIGPADLRSSPYMPGAEFSPVGWSPETIAGVQQQLVDAGLLRSEFVVGVWDESSRGAYRDLLAYANSLGTTDEFALRHWMSTGQQVVDPTPTPVAPFTARVTNPEDIKPKLGEFLRELTGTGKIDDARLDAMVRAYQGEEVAAQRAQYDLAQSGEGGTVTAPRSFESFATEQAKKANPVGFRAHQYLDKFSVIADALGTGGAQ